MRQRLLQSIVGVALVALLVLGIPLAVVVDRLLRTQAQERVDRRADNVSLVITDDLNRGQVPDQARLEALRRDDERIEVTLASGRTVAAGTMPPKPRLERSLQDQSGVRVRIFEGARDLEVHIRNDVLALEALGLLALVLAGLLAVRQANQLSRPLQDLADTAGELGAGDFSLSTPRSGVPEIDAIAESLDRANARIARMVRNEREFSANASHQLRSALTALMLPLEELALSPDEATRSAAEAALRQAERLDATLTDLLRLARTGRSGEREEVDLVALVHSHLRPFERLLAGGGRVAEVDAPPEVHLRCVPGAVGQALDVLVDNAVTHGSGTVTVGVHPAGDHVVVSVSDEGPGVPDAERRGLFDRQPSAEGHGIGLALARTLVEADGGRLDLASGRPARFRMVLPLDPTGE